VSTLYFIPFFLCFYLFYYVFHELFLPLLSQSALSASHYVCASFLLLDTYQMLQHSGYLLASLISGLCHGTRCLPCILFCFSLIFTYFIEPFRGCSCLCSVKAPFSASHHVCTSFLLLNVHQMPWHFGCPLASLISKHFLSDALEKHHGLFHRNS
jgi:hypothetical protein